MAFRFALFNYLWGLGSLAVAAVQALWGSMEKRVENPPEAREAESNSRERPATEVSQHAGNKDSSLTGGSLSSSGMAALMEDPVLARLLQPQTTQTTDLADNARAHADSFKTEDRVLKVIAADPPVRPVTRGNTGGRAKVQRRPYSSVLKDAVLRSAKRKRDEQNAESRKKQDKKGSRKSRNPFNFLEGSEMSTRDFSNRPWTWFPARQLEGYLEDPLIGPELRKWMEEDAQGSSSKQDANPETPSVIDADGPVIGPELRRWELQDSPIPFRAHVASPDPSSASDTSPPFSFATQCQPPYGEEDSWSDPESFHDYCARRRDSTPKQHHSDDEAAKRKRHLNKERAALRAYKRQMQIRAKAAREGKSYTTLREEIREWKDESRVDEEGHIVVKRVTRDTLHREEIIADPARGLPACTWHKSKTQPEKRGRKSDVPVIKLTDPEGAEWFLQDLRYYPDEDYDDEDDSDGYVYGDAEDEEGAC